MDPEVFYGAAVFNEPGVPAAVGVAAETMEKIECNGARYTIFTLERSMSMMSLRMRSFA